MSENKAGTPPLTSFDNPISELLETVFDEGSALEKRITNLGRRLFPDYKQLDGVTWGHLGQGWMMHQCAIEPMSLSVRTALNDGRITAMTLSEWAEAFERMEPLSVERKAFVLAASWHLMLVESANAILGAPDSRSPSWRSYINDLLKTAKYIGRVEGAIQQKQMHAKAGAAARISKNLKPKRDAAITAIRNELETDPDASANEIAERLIGCPSIKLKHRSLAELASAEKKRRLKGM